MKAVWALAALAALFSCVDSKYSPPKVQVYSQGPGQFGKENMLICHVSDFHPPDISIQLFQDGKELPSPQQSDLTFNKDWHFHLTKNAKFTPSDGGNVACKVTHANIEKDYAWVPNM